MTILAWDGQILAADRQATSGGYGRECRKVHIVPDGLVAFCGGGCAAAAMLAWFQNGRDTEKWPAIQHTDKDCQSFFIDWNGQLWIYEDHPHPQPFFNKYDACGSGRDYALAAMWLGHDATVAVQAAIAHDVGCGLGWDAINLAEARACHTS